MPAFAPFLPLADSCGRRLPAAPESGGPPGDPLSQHALFATCEPAASRGQMGDGRWALSAPLLLLTVSEHTAALLLGRGLPALPSALPSSLGFRVFSVSYFISYMPVPGVPVRTQGALRFMWPTAERPPGPAASLQWLLLGFHTCVPLLSSTSLLLLLEKRETASLCLLTLNSQQAHASLTASHPAGGLPPWCQQGSFFEAIMGLPKVPLSNAG